MVAPHDSVYEHMCVKIGLEFTLWLAKHPYFKQLCGHLEQNCVNLGTLKLRTRYYLVLPRISHRGDN